MKQSFRHIHFRRGWLSVDAEIRNTQATKILHKRLALVLCALLWFTSHYAYSMDKKDLEWLTKNVGNTVYETEGSPKPPGTYKAYFESKGLYFSRVGELYTERVPWDKIEALAITETDRVYVWYDGGLEDGQLGYEEQYLYLTPTHGATAYEVLSKVEEVAKQGGAHNIKHYYRIADSDEVHRRKLKAQKEQAIAVKESNDSFQVIAGFGLILVVVFLLL